MVVVAQILVRVVEGRQCVVVVVLGWWWLHRFGLVRRKNGVGDGQ